MDPVQSLDGAEVKIGTILCGTIQSDLLITAQWHILTCSSAIEGSSVKIQSVESASILQLAEVQVFGTLTGVTAVDPPFLHNKDGYTKVKHLPSTTATWYEGDDNLEGNF